MKKALFLMSMLAFAFGASAEKADSVGTKVKNGKVYILHKVEKGETLYGLSKKYDLALSQLIAENPNSDVEGIKTGQTLWIPTPQELKLEEPVVEDFFERTETMDAEPPPVVEDTAVAQSETWGIYHTVSTGETLYALARKYNTTVDVIKSLNQLTSDVLSEGQRLMVPSNGGVTESEPVDEAGDFELDVEGEVADMDLPVVEVMEEEAVEIEGYTVKVIKLE